MLDTYIATAPVAATRGRGQNRKRKKNSKRPTETGQEVGVRVATPDWFQFMGMVPVDISCVLRAPFSQSALFFFKIDRWRLRLHCPPEQLLATILANLQRADCDCCMVRIGPILLPFPVPCSSVGRLVLFSFFFLYFPTPSSINNKFGMTYFLPGQQEETPIGVESNKPNS